MKSESPLVVVHAFASQAEADLAKSALEAAAIDAIIQADSAGGQYPGVATTHGFAIIVRAEDEPAARDILELPARNL
jgi:hypothetical protein